MSKKAPTVVLLCLLSLMTLLLFLLYAVPSKQVQLNNEQAHIAPPQLSADSSGSGFPAEQNEQQNQASTTVLSSITPLVTRVMSEPAIHSPIAIIRQRKSKTTIFGKEISRRTSPASLTKILSCLVATERINDLDASAPIDELSYQEMLAANASLAGFSSGEGTTYRDLLYGSLLCSGGEATATLAVRLAGTRELFVEWLNAKASALQLADSHFGNEIGFDEQATYSTAADICSLLDFALDNPVFKEIFCSSSYLSSKTLEHPEGLPLYSTVLTRVEVNASAAYEIKGGKSGTTGQAGQCWACLVELKGAEYIIVVMGAELGSFEEPNNYHIEDVHTLVRALADYVN